MEFRLRKTSLSTLVAFLMFILVFNLKAGKNVLDRHFLERLASATFLKTVQMRTWERYT